MAKFDVTIKDIEIYIIKDVEADNEPEAIEYAFEMMDGNKAKYHHDSDGAEEAIEQ